MSFAVTCLVATFVTLTLLRVPIAYAMFSGSIVYLWVSGQDVGLVVDQTMNTLSGLYVLLAVPMFILAANVMNATTISDRLWAAADGLVGRWRGGVGHVTVIVNIIFSGISGSAVTDAAGPGMLAMRMMRDVSGYPAGFSAALIASASTIAPIIPPSIPMILYALLSGASVGALFLGGVVPGFLMAGSLMVAIAVVARTRGLPKGEAIPVRKLPRVPRAGPDPDDAAGRATGRALLGRLHADRGSGGGSNLCDRARRSCLPQSRSEKPDGRNAGIGTAIRCRHDADRQRVRGELRDHVGADRAASCGRGHRLAPGQPGIPAGRERHVSRPGCFLDASVLLLVFVPVLLPAAKALGLDMVHFGVVVIVNLMIGLVTPPYGLLLFVLAALGRVPLVEIIREIWIFIIPLTVVLLLLILFPELVLALPRWAGMVK